MPAKRIRALCASFGTLVVAVATTTGAASARDEDLFVRAGDQRSSLFASADVGRSAFLSAGAKQTLTGPLDRPGFVLMETTGVGYTRERAQVEGLPIPLQRFIHETSVLVGHQWSVGRAYVAAFAGPELHQQQVAVAGRFERFSKPRIGARAQLEVWSTPLPRTLLAATVIAGSGRESLYARASAGIGLTDSVYVGPEVATYATRTYNEVRWGAHVTVVPTGILGLRISGGWMRDVAHRRGSPYGALSAWLRL